MKIFSILIILLFTTVCNGQIIPKDKQLHIYCGAASGTWFYTLGQNKRPVLYGITGSALVGIGKESWDKINGRPFDMRDLGFTIIGGVISSGIITGIRKMIKHKKNKIWDGNL